MAEESQYRMDNKRKYDDHQTPPSSGPRRPTGFSAPITSQSSDSAPPSYNNVPPPADEIQLAKLRAQEIAARIYNNAEAKRPRVENSGGTNDSDDFAPRYPGQQIPSSQVGINQPSSVPDPYGFQGSSRKIEIPNGRVGVIIGKSGETIKNLQLQSGAKIQVTRDMDADPHSMTRMVELTGTPEQINKAEQLVKDVLAEAEAGGSGTGGRRFTAQAGADQFQMKIPSSKVGLVVGKGGETIKNMQARSGARIQVIPLHPPPGDTSTERTVYIDGTPEQIESAKELVNEVISQNRVRNQSMGGGYPQQGYRPPSWGPPGPSMQQPGYGYMQQSGAYPGQTPQGNTSQSPYPGYPPQPTPGGFSSGWDQTPGQPNQSTVQGNTGYDYYGQPQPHGAHSTTTDNRSYGYGQAPASTYGQQQGSYGESGYSQPPCGQQGYTDAYGVYHPPAPQPGYGSQTNSQTGGYDQQQQGYSSSGPTYGTGVNPSQEGATPSYGAQVPTQLPPNQQVSPAPNSIGYGSQQPNSTPSSYPSQGLGQPGGYGFPPTSQPAYGPSPTSQPGYGSQLPAVAQTGHVPPQGQKLPPGQAVYGSPPPSSTPGNMQSAPVHHGYPHSVPPSTAQPGYAKPDSAHYQPPTSGYGTAPSYGQPPSYGSAMTSQPGYGQQQQLESGYSRLPSHSNNSASAGGTGQGASYDAAAVSQSGAAKSSPPS